MSDSMGRRFHVAQNGRKFGPLSLAEISTRRLSSDMLVWCEGMTEWVPVADLDELRPYVRHAAAQRPVVPPKQTEYSRSAELQSAGPEALPPAPPVPPPPASTGEGRIMFVAITTIVLGAVGLLGCPLAVIGSFMNEQAARIADEIGVGRTEYLVLWVVVFVVLLMVSIAMLVGGVGLLWKRSWAAATSRIASAVCLMVNLVTGIWQLFFVLVPVGKLVADGASGWFLVMSGLNLTGFVMLCGVIWHVTSLLVLNSAGARAGLR